MNEYIFDTNIFNRLLDGNVDLQRLDGKVCYATHIQFDEIHATKNVQRRSDLEKLFTEIINEQLLTQSFVLDVSRLDEAQLGNGEIYNQILNLLNQRNKEKPNNIQDALIGETALVNGLILVTEDQDLRNVIAELGGLVLNLQKILE